MFNFVVNRKFWGQFKMFMLTFKKNQGGIWELTKLLMRITNHNLKRQDGLRFIIENASLAYLDTLNIHTGLSYNIKLFGCLFRKKQKF